MKQFKFRLQTLLDQRQALEEKLTRELGMLRAEEHTEIMELRRLEERSSEAFGKLSAKLSQSSIDPVEINRLDEFARGTLEDIEAQETVVEDVHSRVMMKQEEVIEAMKARKVLETLKEKQLAAHNLAQMRAEQSQLDEMSSLRYARGM